MSTFTTDEFEYNMPQSNQLYNREPEPVRNTEPTTKELVSQLGREAIEEAIAALPDAARPPREPEYVVVACHDCGLAYGSEGWIECVLPREQWHRISPTGNDGGILCITCIARRLKRLGGPRVPVMLCGTEAIVVADQDEAFDRGWRVAEKRINELDATLNDLLTLHNVPDVSALNVYIGHLEQRSQVAALSTDSPAEPRTDTERLDWLEKNGRDVSIHCWNVRPEGEPDNGWSLGSGEEFDDIGKGVTLRMAIDDAIRHPERLAAPNGSALPAGPGEAP